MDITLQIMASAPTHDLSYDVMKSARRYINGDVVAVYNRAEIKEPPSPNSRMIFVHITGVPVTALRKIKRRLLESQVNPLDAEEIWKRRVWNIDLTMLPASIKMTLKQKREITVSWTQVKNYLVNKVTLAKIKDTNSV